MCVCVCVCVCVVHQEAVGEVFDRVGHGEAVEEVDMKKLLMDPVAVEWLDSLTCYTLPVSLHYTHFFYTAQKFTADQKIL